MTTTKEGVVAVHVRTVILSAVISACASAVAGGLGASFAIARTVAVDSTRIGALEQVTARHEANQSSFVRRDEFMQFRGEAHDFFVRQDARADELMREHARLSARVGESK